MSLNDPHWGRGPEEPQDPKKDKDAREEERPAGESERGSGDRNERHADREAGRRDGRRQEARPEDDLDALWENVADMVREVMGGGRPAGKGRAKRASDELKSRDDFSTFEPSKEEGGEPERAERGETAGPRVRPTPHEDDGRTMSVLQRFLRAQQERERREKAAGRGGRGGNSEKRSGLGAGVFLFFLAAGWAASGFYIVPEGQTGVVTTFGRYAESTMPGFHWHVPSPVESVQLVDVSSVRTAEIGGAASSNRLREALMLTDDENIVDVQFTVQYRIKPETGAKDYLFNTRAPDTSVVQAAESAMREVVGRKTMDSILFESKAEIAEAVKHSMQGMLDRYATGIEVMSVAIQNAQPPQPVQAAFNDAVKAGQDRERAINLGEAYMNAVLPKAQGTASRLKEEAEGYKARVVETATGDADRFSAVYKEYRAAPEVTRDRLYVDAMRDVFSNVSKVYVDSRSGNNLLYLPLDKIVTRTKEAARAELPDSGAAAAATSGVLQGAAPAPQAQYETEPAQDLRDIRSRIR